MDIKIGVIDIAREVAIEVAESAESIQAKVAEAITNGSILTLTDEKGRTVMVPADRIGYVDCGPEHKRSVGFGAV